MCATANRSNKTTLCPSATLGHVAPARPGRLQASSTRRCASDAKLPNGAIFCRHASWEKQIKKRDQKLQRKAQRKAAKRAPAAAARASQPAVPAAPAGTADGHTYDKGYKRWENFDVDSAVAAVDREEDNPSRGASADPDPAADDDAVPVAVAATAPRPQRADTAERERLEREQGNAHFAKGEFHDAVKCYTRCIAVNPRNYIAHSNRAMAQLKLKDYRKAEADCTSALRINPDHGKSLRRRGTAPTGSDGTGRARRLPPGAPARAPEQAGESDVRKTRSLCGARRGGRRGGAS